MAGLFTVPAGLSFVDTLAARMLADAAEEPLALAEAEVLLPTRRACRALREAFLRQSGGRPLLLPRMRPIDCVDEDEAALVSDASLDLPPAIEPLRRHLLLTRLVLAMGAGRGGHTPSPDQAARLARELAKLLDSVQIERLSFDRLEQLVPEDLANHWQETIRFLDIITGAWPVILAENKCVDPQDRVNRVLEAQAALWRVSPPAHPVIAAGSTGTRPATADLLEVVAGLPRGMVVLPGLDRELDSNSWEKLDPAHPQYGMKRLLERLGAARAGVAVLGDGHSGQSARIRLIAEAMRPAATCEAWRDLPALPPETLAGVARLDASGPREEAGAIALMMRQALEEKGRTAALVTPDRDLARRVAAELERWGVAVDDSAGRPLGLTEPGAFLRLVAAMVAEGFAPHATLAALKHPLAAGGLDSASFRAKVRRLELSALRGPRPAPGVEGLKAAAAADLRDWLDGLGHMAAPFAGLMDSKRAPLSELVRTHMELAEALAADATLPGPARLWKGEAGEALARFAAELADAAPALGDTAPAVYPALFDELLPGQVVRPVWGRHPRLSILGPLEARLQQADLMILGGLNEGTWPAMADVDPWMSRPMREAFGLPPHERRIGLSAHDFAQAMAAPRVVLTRSERVEGTPTVPSRWLLRLDAVLHASGLTVADAPSHWMAEDTSQWLEWHDLLDRPEAFVRVGPPAPRPPLNARPRSLSVTEIETWMRDPYAIYARRVLDLTALPPIDEDPGAADYGSLVHKALERFLKEGAGSEERLVAIGAEMFREALARPGVWAFWWPRFLSVARWFAAKDRERREGALAVHAEIDGRLEIAAPGGPFLLRARADRVERRSDETLALIDYKTGAVPRKKEVAAGFAPQLPLEAAIALHGGFQDIPAAPVSDLLFWRLKGGDEGGEESRAGDDPTLLAGEALDGLAALVATYDDADVPYPARPHPEHAPRYSYLHLARVREWASAGEEGED